MDNWIFNPKGHIKMIEYRNTYNVTVHYGESLQNSVSYHVLADSINDATRIVNAFMKDKEYGTWEIIGVSRSSDILMREEE